MIEQIFSDEEKDRLDYLLSKENKEILESVFGGESLSYEQIAAVEKVLKELEREQKADLWAEGAYAVTNGKWDLPDDMNPYGETSQDREEREFRATHHWDDETREWVANG